MQSSRAVLTAIFVVVAVLLARPAAAAFIGVWSFDSDYRDASGFGSHLRSASGPVHLVPGLFGNAASFDGGSFLWSSSNLLTRNRTELSMGAWVKASGNPGPDAILLGNFYGGGPSYNAGLTDDRGRVHAYVRDGANHADSGTLDIHDGEWHHVAFTFDGSRIRLYVDGALRTNRSSAHSGTVAAAEFSVGGRSVLSNTFTGLIDEAFFSADVLSTSEIAGLATFPVPEPGTAVLVLGGLAGTGALARRRPRDGKAPLRGSRRSG